MIIVGSANRIFDSAWQAFALTEYSRKTIQVQLTEMEMKLRKCLLYLHEGILAPVSGTISPVALI